MPSRTRSPAGKIPQRLLVTRRAGVTPAGREFAAQRAEVAAPAVDLKTMTRTPSTAFALCLLASAAASAASSDEFWPELSAFIQLDPRYRVYLDASYAQGKEAKTRALDATAAVDISLLPILREQLHSEDWQRGRYLWARLGYTRVTKADESRDLNRAEDRGIVALHAKNTPFADVWVEARGRADLRWIDGRYSTRYRFRLEATREFTVLEHAVVPYFNFEWFRDTRYDGLSRTLAQGGAELTFSERFRTELYLARQEDRRPSPATLNAFGVVAKWYY